MIFKFRLKAEYAVEADNVDEAINALEAQLTRENTTPEIEFWNSLEMMTNENHD